MRSVTLMGWFSFGKGVSLSGEVRIKSIFQLDDRDTECTGYLEVQGVLGGRNFSHGVS